MKLPHSQKIFALLCTLSLFSVSSAFSQEMPGDDYNNTPAATDSDADANVPVATDTDAANTQENGPTATDNLQADTYKLQNIAPEKKLEDNAEMVAMRFADDYSMRFDDYSVDEAMRDRTVYERSRPEYEPQHVRLGSFILAPQIGVGYNYNDNVYSTETNEKEDFLTRVKPAMLLRSDWNSHSLSAGLVYDVGLYNKYTDENFIDATYTLNGQLDVLQDSYISAGVLVQTKHEDRGSPDDVNGSKPTVYALNSANLEFYRKVSRVLLKVSLDARQYDFSSTPSPTGDLDNGDRDRYEYEGTTRVAYEFKPGYQAFVDVSYNIREYVRDDAADLRNSQGYKVNVGTAIDLTGQTKAEVYAGYLAQDYENDNFDDASGVNYGANLLWNITRLTSIKFDANRTVGETTLSNSSGFITSLADISIEHELRRNILLNAGFTYAINEYDGIDRTDNIYSLSTGARYIITPNFTLNFDYNIQVRDSDAAGRDFQRNRVLLSLKAEL